MRLDGIRIQEFTNQLFVKDVVKIETPNEISISDKPVQEDDVAVKLSLSKKLLGLKSFEERIKEDDPNDPMVASMSKEMKTVLLAEMDGKVVIKEKYSLLFIGGGSGRVVMNRMLEEYAKRYDELVQGYNDGTRSIFITDSKTGEFRTLTLEEELQELDEHLKRAIDCFNGLVDQMPKIADCLERYANQLDESVKKYGCIAAIEMAEQARDHAQDLRRDLKNMPERPEERERRMYAAVDAFLAQYTGWKAAGMDIKSMVGTITIF